MTSIAVAKLIIDGLLLSSLIFVAFRMLGRQQPGAIANLAKLKELESSLKEIVREADDASNNLSQELLGRKRDLEKVLSEAEGAESRFNKSKASVEELINAAASAQARLEQSINKQLETLKSSEQQSIARNAFIETPVFRSPVAPAEPQHSTESFNYAEILEPPSFSRDARRSLTLREQIEVENAEFQTSRPTPVRQEQQEAARPAKASNQMRVDPRLGVLGALNKESNIY